MTRSRTTDLQIRGLPVTLRERLRKRAGSKGVSMSQYVTDLLKTDLALPSLDEWFDELHALPKIDLAALGTSGAQIIREVRREREKELDERISSSSTRRRR